MLKGMSFSKISEKMLPGIFIGVLIHGFALVNKWPNWDDLGQTWDNMNRISLGRWFLVVPTALSSFLSMPYINGLLMIFYIVISANLVISLCDLKNNYSKLMVYVIMLAFPSVGAMIFYSNSMDGYAFAILLMTLGVWWVANKKTVCGMLGGVAAITLSMGCYQAYFAFGAALVVVYVVEQLLYSDTNVKRIMQILIKYAVVFATSIVLYMVISKMIVKENGFANYMGIDQMGNINLKELPGYIAKAYIMWFGYYFQDNLYVHGKLTIAVVILLTLTVIFVVIGLLKQKENCGRIGLVILILLCFPLVCSAVCLIGADNVHTIMKYGIVGTYILCITVLDKEWKLFRKSCILGGVMLVLIAGKYVISTNMAYFCAHISYEETYAYTNRMLTKIEMVEGFSTEDEIILIGMPYWSFDKMDVAWMKEPMYATFTGLSRNLVQNSSFPLLCSKYCGFHQDMCYLDSSELVYTMYHDVIDEMPIYPTDGSIVRTADGYVLVKFSEVAR